MRVDLLRVFDNRNHLALFTVSFPLMTRENAFLLSAEACHRFRGSIEVSLLLLLVRARDDERVEKHRKFKMN